jgi:hypothetical protein
MMLASKGPAAPALTPHAFAGLAALLLAASPVAAQQAVTVKVENVQVGFHGGAEGGGLFKPGLWTPVRVTLRPAADGDLQLPARPDGTIHGVLRVEGTDADGGNNVYEQPFVLTGKEAVTVIAYTMPGSTTADLQVSLVPWDEKGALQANRKVRVLTDSFVGLGLHQHLYLVLGAAVPNALHDALRELAGKAVQDGGPRAAGFETEAALLPDDWFGYQAVDWLVLTTANERFLDELRARPAKVQALAEWVRRGGRLLISVSASRQPAVSRLLAGPAWQPALPAFLPADGRPAEVASLASVQSWANVLNKPFPIPRARSLPIARLQAGLSTEVFVREESGEPILLRVPYGLGSITLLALDVDQPPFSAWKGAADFWKVLVNRLAPRAPARLLPDSSARLNPEAGADVSTRLHRELDNFDVPVVSFGWVAVLILLYILVVGPLDYLLLKKVLKRLEWTWITFPAVVVLVSAVAYFATDALKGNQLKVNKIDLVDLDLRSDLDVAGKTRKAYAYGTSWFAVLSPATKSYAIGIKPAVGAWAERAGGVTVTWLGRPEPAGQGALGRPRAQTLFSRTYRYDPHAAGLRDVAIPIWTTKAFTATWDAPLAGLPFTADLHYRPGDPDQQLVGTIQNNLPVSLEDVYLFYGNKAYPVEGPLRGGQQGGPVPVVLEPGRRLDAERWATSGLQPAGPDGGAPAAARRPFQPVPILKELLFHEFAGGLNHSFRRLDQSWRLHELQGRDAGMREAILCARLPRAEGAVQALASANDPRLPAHLAPELDGTLVQDTYLRVFFPVRPQ